MIKNDKAGIEDFLKDLNTKALELSGMYIALQVGQLNKIHYRSLAEASKYYLHKLKAIETNEKS